MLQWWVDPGAQLLLSPLATLSLHHRDVSGQRGRLLTHPSQLARGKCVANLELVMGRFQLQSNCNSGSLAFFCAISSNLVPIYITSKFLSLWNLAV